LLGKLFAHASIYLGIGLIALGFIWPLFDIPMVGSSLLAVGLLLAFILASLSLSFAVSCVLGNKFIAADFAALYNSPAFLFSGYTYPLWAMPKAHYIYAQLLPFTHFLSGFIKVYSMGSPGKYLLPEFGNLAIFIFVGFTVSLLMLKFKVKPAALSQMPVAEKAR
jgi:ABC-2 type transport system permease protein